jgi:hypothetical protein
MLRPPADGRRKNSKYAVVIFWSDPFFDCKKFELWSARPAAVYVDRILKDAEPSDLPIQQPTKFELVINLKTSKVLSLTLSKRLSALADELIE